MNKAGLADRLFSALQDDAVIGSVEEVNAGNISVLLRSVSEGRSSKVVPHVGTYVIIPADEVTLFGEIKRLQVAKELRSENGQVPIYATVEIVSSVYLSDLEVVGGIVQTPNIGATVYAPSGEALQYVLSGILPDSAEVSRVGIRLGQLPDAFDSALDLPPEHLFGRHLAIVGTTGSGKSWSIARIIEECSVYRSKVILLDPTGEYREMSANTRHVHFGDDPKAPEGSQEICLPYFHLTEVDLFSIFRPSGMSQAPKLRAAMKSLKLAQVSESVGLDGLVIKAHKSKKQYERSYRFHQDEIESPFASFDIRKLTRQIENECVHPQRSSTEPDTWGGINGVDLANCMPLIGRIDDILQSPNLAPIFRPGKKQSLLEVIHDFLRDPEDKVLRVNMQYLSSAFGARKTIANAIGRHLFELAQKGAFLKRPLLTVIDEAHQFLKREEEDADHQYSLESFSLIAKEGRKYSLSTCIATQRPRDIPEDVLSQMGTIVIHRLINAGDRGIVEKACGEVNQSSLNRIPSLAPGEAILAGVYFPVPLRIRVKSPACEPNSEGADYQRFWGV